MSFAIYSTREVRPRATDTESQGRAAKERAVRGDHLAKTPFVKRLEPTLNCHELPRRGDALSCNQGLGQRRWSEAEPVSTPSRRLVTVAFLSMNNYAHQWLDLDRLLTSNESKAISRMST